jgi:predicted glycoside hydrolase/deacetylase ChbG (UPF0249 family)
MNPRSPENTPNLRVFPDCGKRAEGFNPSAIGAKLKLANNRGDKPHASLSLVLHADDFGMNRSVTDGILFGFRSGLLTSTSLLSNAPDADRAVSLWKQLLQVAEHPTSANFPSLDARRRLGDHILPFDLGVHLNLTQGRPLTGKEYPRRLLDREGCFSLFAHLRKCDAVELDRVKAELSRQIEFALERGLRPTHLNGHQYIEMLPAISAMLPELLDRHGIRVVRVAEEPHLFKTTLVASHSPPKWALANVKRFFARRFHALMDRIGIAHPQHFHGTAHAGHVDLNLMKMFCELPSPFGRGAGGEGQNVEQSGSKNINIEVGLHPALESAKPSTDPAWNDPLAAARPLELDLLTGRELLEKLESDGIRLGRLSKLAAA